MALTNKFMWVVLNKKLSFGVFGETTVVYTNSDNTKFAYNAPFATDHLVHATLEGARIYKDGEDWKSAEKWEDKPFKLV